MITILLDELLAYLKAAQSGLPWNDSEALVILENPITPLCIMTGLFTLMALLLIAIICILGIFPGMMVNALPVLVFGMLACQCFVSSGEAASNENKTLPVLLGLMSALFAAVFLFWIVLLILPLFHIVIIPLAFLNLMATMPGLLVLSAMALTLGNMGFLCCAAGSWFPGIGFSSVSIVAGLAATGFALGTFLFPAFGSAFGALVGTAAGLIAAAIFALVMTVGIKPLFVESELQEMEDSIINAPHQTVLPIKTYERTASCPYSVRRITNCGMITCKRSKACKVCSTSCT